MLVLAPDLVREKALSLGFDECRFATARQATHAEEFTQWIADDAHGDMAWLARDPHRRVDPREVLADCKTVICLALNYFPAQEHPNKGYRIARYAWNDDYHDLISARLKEFDDWLQAQGATQKKYVDTGPVLERDFASDSGLGWNGKSTVQIHRSHGAWLFLAEILTTANIAADAPFGDHCGKCTRCITACPTQAITAPHRVDARRCISYLTIENKGSIPVEFRRAIGDRLYGCDACLEVCPWNRFAHTSKEITFHAREEIFRHDVRDFLTMEEETFRKAFAKSPIKRIKLPRLKRNACIVLGNTGTQDDIKLLEKMMSEDDPLIKEHAAWAIDEIKQRSNEPIIL